MEKKNQSSLSPINFIPEKVKLSTQVLLNWKMAERQLSLMATIRNQAIDVCFRKI